MRAHILGLIPAHAGKTNTSHGYALPKRAHPRSRGENVFIVRSFRAWLGSSPLTRGKQLIVSKGGKPYGLIPAHAGKTAVMEGDPLIDWAHPRSRGENSPCTTSWLIRLGSSPLTRGKRHGVVVVVGFGGLIPAHAGKTFWLGTRLTSNSAHPRSRGENPTRSTARTASTGSSPLTRGKRAVVFPLAGLAGLIPAHAGKTSTRRTRTSERAAHPRSRGENAVIDTLIADRAGSSPLTRGKPNQRPLRCRASGLIPAHAGKTLRIWGVSQLTGAHPRSRGEN